jgi:hypothetical protein
MTVKKLIKKLREIQKEHGNIPVKVGDVTVPDTAGISCVEFEEGDNYVVIVADFED